MKKQNFLKEMETVPEGEIKAKMMAKMRAEAQREVSYPYHGGNSNPNTRL